MKVIERFKNSSDLQQCMSGIVCKYKGRWCYLGQIYDGVLKLWYLDDAEAFKQIHGYRAEPSARFHAKEEDWSNFEIVSPSLGYVNAEKTKRLQYVKRGTQNTTQMAIGHGTLLWGSKETEDFVGKISDPGFIKMLDNKYPSFSNAWTQCAELNPTTRIEGAFDNKFALRRTHMRIVDLHYMDQHVGEMPVSLEPSEVMLYPAFDYLSRLIKQKLNVEVKVA